MAGLVKSVYRLSDSVTRIPSDASASTRARARALVIWTVLAVPLGVLLVLVSQDMNFTAPTSISVMLGATGMVLAVLHLRYYRNPDQASLIFVWSGVLGLGGSAWIEADPSLSPLIFLAATPVYFGLIARWQKCANYTLSLLVFYLMLSVWQSYRGVMSPEEVLNLVACGLAALGAGLSTTAYSYTTERAAMKLKRQTAEITALAYNDPLTGILNRRAFNDFLNQDPKPESVDILAVIDLDDFKEVNDRCGHEVGDEVLVEFASRLTTLAKGQAKVFRLGGDEFVLVAENEFAYIEFLGETLSKISDRPYATSIGEMPINLSIGLASSRFGQISPRQMFREADTALFEAKRSTGSNWVTFCDGLGVLKERASKLSELLQIAINNGEMGIAFQPQYDVSDNSIIGFEALARWTTRAYGSVSPGEFIPIAEKANLIAPLDRAVFETAIRFASEWLHDTQKLAINVSGRTLLSEGFVDFVKHAVDHSALGFSQIQVEITETEIIENKADAIDACHRMKDLGVSIALDDFGTGYSSLSYLSTLPVNTLKVDRSFVHGSDRESNLKVMRSIIGLAQSLGLDLLVEGVEHEWQLDTIKSLGCHCVQGFYFSRPLASDQCRDLNEISQLPVRFVGT